MAFSSLGQIEALRELEEAAVAAAVFYAAAPIPWEGLLADRATPSDSSSAAGTVRLWQQNRISATAHEEQNPMCRVMLLVDRNKFRVRVIDRETGRMTSTIHATEEEARAKMRKIKRE